MSTWIGPGNGMGAIVDVVVDVVVLVVEVPVVLVEAVVVSVVVSVLEVDVDDVLVLEVVVGQAVRHGHNAGPGAVSSSPQFGEKRHVTFAAQGSVVVVTEVVVGPQAEQSQSLIMTPSPRLQPNPMSWQLPWQNPKVVIGTQQLCGCGGLHVSEPEQSDSEQVVAHVTV